jgi:hypothetical protein
MNAMKLAITNSQAIDAEYSSADDLLAELAGSGSDDDDQPDHERAEAEPAQDTEQGSADAGGTEKAEQATPPTPQPQKSDEPAQLPMHSIPHNKSNNKSHPNSQHNSAILEGVVSENTGFDQK